MSKLYPICLTCGAELDVPLKYPCDECDDGTCDECYDSNQKEWEDVARQSKL